MQNRDSVDPGQIPEVVRDAFIATEDKRFEEHSGVDFLGIGRAVVVDVIHRSAKEGGSTITQQLAKNLYLTQEKTLFRKAKEVSIAIALESRYTKDQILAMYLNTIYFGDSAYGIKAAAKTYFNKDNLNDLTIAEAAMLAGLPKAPSYYNPIDYPDRAVGRRTVVLSLMKEQGYITEKQQKEADATPYRAPANRANSEAYWGYVDYVFQEAEEKAGLTPAQIYANGYKIYTAMNVKAQNAVEDAFANDALFPTTPYTSDTLQAAAVIVDHHNGKILAMLGGRNYRPRSFNRAAQPRQPGSSFKPIIVYGPALETGQYKPDTLLMDKKMSFGDYSPRNYNNIYKGKVTMTEAIEKSMNLPAVWLLNKVGLTTSMNFADSMGISLDSKNDRNLAIALGGLTRGVTPLQMAQAYSAFANLGTWNAAYAIEKIVDKDGNVLYSHDDQSKRVMTEQNAYYMTQMLQTVISKGTGQRASMNRPVAGKTGTTQVNVAGAPRTANRDAWFVGYTPEWSAAIWMGFDRTTDKNYMISGSGMTANLFSKIMTQALRNTPVKPFTKPDGAKAIGDAVAIPANVTANYKQSINAVTLNWTASAEAKSYEVYRRSIDEDTFGLLGKTAGTQFMDSTVEGGKDYEYYVLAVKSDTEKSKQSEVMFISVPNPDDSTDPNLIPSPSPSPSTSPTTTVKPSANL
jgi:penicillin-binding protein 2A